MRVVVPTLQFQSHAHLALVAEGIEHEERICNGDFGYSMILAEMWRYGEGFIVVEHDIAPWMGAVNQLAVCERDWCMFRYPKYGGALTRGLGCAKFSDRIVKEYPNLADKWEGFSWRVLDGTIGAAVAEVLKNENPGQHPLCYHDPPVAHVRKIEVE